MAALHSIHLEGKRALVLDIGGGSVELALGKGSQVEWAASKKLGVLRMAEQFASSDPLPKKDEERLESHVREQVAPEAEKVRTTEVEVSIGTSGTILALGGMAHQMETGRPAETLHHLTVKASTLHDLRQHLLAADFKERLRMPGMDELRADVIPAGAVILDTVLDALGIKELVLCEWALREGILLDYIHGHPKSLARAEAYPDVRRRSVVALAERCLYDEPHARHVAALATSLFDQTRDHHGLGDTERALLEFAALLHDIGHHISYPGHHKHSYYLIKNGDLRGFHPAEIEVVANVARYHRRGHPRRGHAAFADLPRETRQTVKVLAGFLRVADALDRSHRQVVRQLTVSERAGVLRVKGEAKGDYELEIWGAGHRTQLLEKALHMPLRVEMTSAARTRRLRAVKP
jgi:exopolyphosphatase/guanosine-5'-triphosphate,3'-diphosphate pyrophosphatase